MRRCRPRRVGTATRIMDHEKQIASASAYPHLTFLIVCVQGMYKESDRVVLMLRDKINALHALSASAAVALSGGG